MKIQVDLPEEINKHLKLHKIGNDFKDLQEALIDALSKFFKKGK